MDIVKRTAGIGTLTVPIDHERVKEVASVLVHVRQLTPYPFGDTELEDWSRSLIALSPAFDIRKLEFVIKCFMLGELEWAKDAGIQNIIMSLKKVHETHSGFRLSHTGSGY